MTNTETVSFGAITPLPRQDMVTVLKRVALSFLLFSGVLCALLALSWVALLPRIASIEVGGIASDVADLRRRGADLRASILDAERSREDLVLALHDREYLDLQALRDNRLSLDEWRVKLTGIAEDVIKQKDAVHLHAVRFDQEEKTLSLDGDVRFVGSRSMTVLAEFVEDLRALPTIASVSTPVFTREEDPVTGPHSPFSLVLRLQ